MWGLRLAMCSPPCKYYSTARMRDLAATEPPLIDRTRDILEGLIEFWSIENVMGAKTAMSVSAVELDGPMFGRESFARGFLRRNFRCT